MDVSHTLTPKSDQLNADDLIASPIMWTVDKVDVKNGGDQPISIFGNGYPRPYKPCKSMRRVLAVSWGSNSANWIGKSMVLFRDENVKWAGKPVGGIRISHLSHINQPATISLTMTRGKRENYVVQVLQQQA
jgi:hypothetical protein